MVYIYMDTHTLALQYNPKFPTEVLYTLRNKRKQSQKQRQIQDGIHSHMNQTTYYPIDYPILTE